MTNNGHLILTDLGMSRILQPGQRSFSYVGTPEYMVFSASRFQSRHRRLLVIVVMTSAVTFGPSVFWRIKSWLAWFPSPETQ